MGSSLWSMTWCSVMRLSLQCPHRRELACGGWAWVFFNRASRCFQLDDSWFANMQPCCSEVTSTLPTLTQSLFATSVRASYFDFSRLPHLSQLTSPKHVLLPHDVERRWLKK